MSKIKLGDVTKIRTGKLDANASSENGKYPFFTCSKDPLRIDSYSYDCECVLVAGNGDLNVKYYKGKFDAYQRTYIIEDNSNGRLFIPYLYFFLELYVEELRKQSIGGVIKYIKLGNLTDAIIELPSIEKQKEIVNILNKSRKIVESKNVLLQSYDQLIKSRFVEMFGTPGKNEKGWILGSISDIGRCVAGATPSTKVKEYWENGTISWMSSGEVNKGRIYDTDTKISELGYKNASTKLVPPHTVVLAMAGQGKTRGTVAITEIELCTNQSLCSIVNNEKIDSEYLLMYLIMQYEELRNVSNGAEGRGGLNLKIIGNFPIMIPPMEHQIKFASIVKQVDKLKFEVQKSLSETQMLFDALMQEYFG
jgi:type I restriction enzyme S subunit